MEKGYFLLHEGAKSRHNIHSVNINISACHSFFGNRCVLLGVSRGANIVDYAARKAVDAGRHLDPVKVVAQVLMHPFFIGSVPTHSEIKLANSYHYKYGD